MHGWVAVVAGFVVVSFVTVLGVGSPFACFLPFSDSVRDHRQMPCAFLLPVRPSLPSHTNTHTGRGRERGRERDISGDFV